MLPLTETDLDPVILAVVYYEHITNTFFIVFRDLRLVFTTRSCVAILKTFLASISTFDIAASCVGS
jgi:hypothetical protein